MGGRGRGQGGCERRIEVFEIKFKKKIFFLGGGRGGGVGGSDGGVGLGGGVRVDVNEIEVFLKIQNNFFWGGVGGGSVGGSGSGWGVRVDVN